MAEHVGELLLSLTIIWGDLVLSPILLLAIYLAQTHSEKHWELACIALTFAWLSTQYAYTNQSITFYSFALIATGIGLLILTKSKPAYNSKLTEVDRQMRRIGTLLLSLTVGACIYLGIGSAITRTAPIRFAGKSTLIYSKFFDIRMPD